MGRHLKRPGETVAQERARLHRKDTGRATKRRNVGAKTRRGR